MTSMSTKLHSVSVPGDLGATSLELRNRLKGFVGMRQDVGAVAGLFAVVYRSQRWGKDGAPSWAAFVEAEGLRVKDLDSRLPRRVVGLLAGALVDVGLTHRDAGVVAGVDHRTAGRNATVVRGPAGVAAARDFAESVVAGILAENEADMAAVPVSPENALILVEERLKVLPDHLAEYSQCLVRGGPIGSGVDRRLRRIHGELVKALDTVEVYRRQRGARP